MHPKDPCRHLRLRISTPLALFIRNIFLQETQPHILPPVNAVLPAAASASTASHAALLELANLSSDALAEKVVSSVLDAGESSGGEGSRSDSNDPIDQISR